MNIAIDIDDTITNTYETMVPMIALFYNKDLNKLLHNKPSYKELYSLPNFSHFAKTHYEIVASIAPLKNGVIDILSTLKKEGHKIIIITARNNEEFHNPYQVSYNYLIKNNIPFDKLIVNASNKAEVCLKEHIDLFIDDSTKNCHAVAKKGIPTIQFNSVFDTNSKLNKVTSREEVYYKIQNMYL